MSDIPADYRDRLDLREQIARIDRAREETLKFTAEQHKLMAEERKLAAEDRKLMAEAAKLAAEDWKLMAEAAKLGRDRLLAPWLAVAGLVGGLITVASAIAHWGH